MNVTDAMVDRFLSWNLPASVCSDTCVSMLNYPHQRSGTNLLTAIEARAMLEHVLDQAEPLDRITAALETAAGALVLIAGVITQPDASEEAGEPDPRHTMDG